MPRLAFGGDVEKSMSCLLVPDHRLVAANGGLGREVDYGHHRATVGGSIELLRDEGMRFDLNGDLLRGMSLEFQ